MINETKTSNERVLGIKLSVAGFILLIIAAAGYLLSNGDINIIKVPILGLFFSQIIWGIPIIGIILLVLGEILAKSEEESALEKISRISFIVTVLLVPAYFISIVFIEIAYMIVPDWLGAVSQILFYTAIFISSLISLITSLILIFKKRGITNIIRLIISAVIGLKLFWDFIRIILFISLI